MKASFSLSCYRLLLGLSLLALLATACQPAATPQPILRSSVPPAQKSASWYQVYFTKPGDAKSGSLRGGPDQDLANAIREARASVDLAVLQLNLWSIRDALLEAYRRGVKVRVVIESEYRDEKEIQALIDAGVPLLGDRREGLMHNKFAVIDRQEVWTGSMNYSTTDGYRNNNNIIRIRSKELAEDYTTEFEEMFLDDQFGPGSPANTPYPSLTIEGTPVSVCFAPDDGCARKVLEVLNGAQKSIYFMVFSFTSDDLARPIFARAKAGVKVAGVMESSQVSSNTGGEFQSFQDAKLDVRKDGNKGNMHHKVMIIDGRYVVTGSYNFTYNGDNRNDENLLIIDNPEIAALYLQEFERVFDAAKK